MKPKAFSCNHENRPSTPRRIGQDDVLSKRRRADAHYRAVRFSRSDDLLQRREIVRPDKGRHGMTTACDPYAAMGALDITDDLRRSPPIRPVRCKFFSFLASSGAAHEQYG